MSNEEPIPDYYFELDDSSSSDSSSSDESDIKSLETESNCSITESEIENIENEIKIIEKETAHFFSEAEDTSSLENWTEEESEDSE